MNSIGVDVGGTFTDLVYCDIDSGEVAIHKVSTTPDDPSNGVMTGILELCRRTPSIPGLDRLRLSRHHDGHQRRAGTQGRANRHDHQRRISRYHSYRPSSARRTLFDPAGTALAEPSADQAPASQGRRADAWCRRTGDELEPLDEDAVRQAAIELRDEGVESVAVCFLFSYLNPSA